MSVFNLVTTDDIKAMNQSSTAPTRSTSPLQRMVLYPLCEILNNMLISKIFHKYQSHMFFYTMPEKPPCLNSISTILAGNVCSSSNIKITEIPLKFDRDKSISVKSWVSCFFTGGNPRTPQKFGISEKVLYTA